MSQFFGDNSKVSSSGGVILFIISVFLKILPVALFYMLALSNGIFNHWGTTHITKYSKIKDPLTSFSKLSATSHRPLSLLSRSCYCVTKVTRLDYKVTTVPAPLLKKIVKSG